MTSTVPPVVVQAPRTVDRFELTCAARTDVGIAREVNEDAFWVDDALGLYLVCDGMGGHASGQIASQLAVRSVVHALKTGEPAPPPGEEPLSAALRYANASVFQHAQADPSCHGMGTTAVGVRAEDDLLHVCHAGDSRCYLLRGGVLSQVTRDHSLVNLYEDRPELRGQLGPATSNVIIRAIGLEPAVEIEHRIIAMEHDDVYVLCCDGLTDLVDDWMIREIVTSGDPMEAVVENLVRVANANGGTDNITVILLHVFNEASLADASGVIGG